MGESETRPQRRCVEHPERSGNYICLGCGRSFCAVCVKVRDFGAEKVYICPVCGDKCEVPAGPAPPETQSFLTELARAWGYPVRGKGKFVLIAGTLFYYALYLWGSIPTAFPIIALLQWAVVVGLTLYVFSYGFAVIAETARGEDEPPDWPELTEPGDVLRPLGLILASLAVCFLPVTAFAIVLGEALIEAQSAMWALIGLGVFFLPMALLSAGLHDSLSGLNPVLLLRSIARIGPAYLAAIATLAVVVVLAYVLVSIPIPILGSLFGIAVDLYCGIVMARVIGLLYACYEDRLRWFTVD